MKALHAILAVALLAAATYAQAVDLHGYFRQGIGGSSKGGNQVALSNTGQDYKLRLGNEDDWSEFEFDQLVLKDKNGVEWQAGFMLGWGDGWSETLSRLDMNLKQSYLRATFPQLGGAAVWGGIRYYHRHANDIYDYFYMNESAPGGVGIEDVDVGFGKLAVAVFRYQTTDNSRDNRLALASAVAACQLNPTSDACTKFAAPGYHPAFWMGDLRLEGVPVNPGGTLSLAVLLKVRSWNKEVAKGFKSIDLTTSPPTETAMYGPDGKAPDKTQDFSPFVMIKHSQTGILNGGNNLAVTYKTGCFLDDGCNENLRKLTVSEDLLLNPTQRFSIIIAGIFMNDQDANKVKKNQYSVAVRPLFKVADHFALAGDAGYFWNKAEHQDKANTMFKATFAPTITPFTDGFYGAHSAPEIRLFATYASWNKEQGGDHKTFDAKGEAESGMTFGAQAEAWF
jgi:maltoporin